MSMYASSLASLLHRALPPHGPVMLMYHSVTPGKITPAWPWAVSMKAFEEQLDLLLAQGYLTPTMRELVDNAGQFAGRRVAVITFDDGYVDNLPACAALERRGMRASWFIVSGSLGQTPGWPGDGRPAGRLLNAEELRAMHAAGMEIGAHTVSHERLPDLQDADLAREITGSRVALQEVLGAEVSSFAYPYGAWDQRCVAAVRAAGYRAACTTRTGWALRDGDPFVLRRLTVFNRDSVSTLARKLHFADHNVSWPALARYGLGRVRSRIGR